MFTPTHMVYRQIETLVDASRLEPFNFTFCIQISEFIFMVTFVSEKVQSKID